ncbi:G-type lectin S-receptor-like serine/threonine-protein kinase RKS1 [Camellia sinensis]|uniref:G-type lectin S-receptor-like serine/threonine-protein kinase RKS1 n=1 Tax=Camellia sinensis TaxID=4442 RepID=UPI00103574B8|nr:G-type lectin S-receptor-like serine/threonine-protein kinase RKS1 [Camellia sinensis]
MLTPRGQAELLLWEQSNNSWVVLWQVPLVKCDFYGYCVLFSSCDENGLHKFCRCLEGFEPKYQKEWKLGNWTGGCTRRTTRTCDIGDQFSKLERMKFPDYSVSLGNMTTVSQCELQCSKNCTCAAYAYTNVSSETVSCMHWFGDIVDLKGNYINGEDLYVRNNDSDQVGNGKLTHKSRSVIAIAAAAISTGLLLICSFGYVLRRWMRSRGRVDRSAHELDANSKASVDDLNNGELLLFSLRSILAATDNFSEANKLGEGGYGPVCKGYLPEVQEVAIKKQSKTSLQGTEEFMNELKFIAELQHKNLVRLLGCCVEQEEKILIYKYMCNGSLDKLLFCTHVYLFSETFDKQFL